MKARIGILTIVALSLMSAPAYALSVGVLGGITTTSISQTPSQGTTFNSDLGYGFGAFVEWGFIPGFSMELNVLDAQTAFTEPANGSQPVDVKVTFNTIQVPLIFRFTALPIVNFGAGIQYEDAIGQITNTPTGQTPQTGSFASVGINTTSWSIPLVIGARFPLAPMLKLVVDARYLIGLTNLDSTGATTLKANHIEALAGLSLGF